MEKSGDMAGFKSPTTCQHISFILGVRVAAEWLSAASTLYPPTLGSVQKSQSSVLRHRLVSLGLCGPYAVPARHWCVPWRCRFDGPAQAPGPPASRRKRTGWPTRGKGGYSDQKEGRGATSPTVMCSAPLGDVRLSVRIGRRADTTLVSVS